MNKKIILLVIPVALLLLWAGANWYLGQQTQSVLQAFISQQNQQLTGLGIAQELVSYEKNLFDATAITRLNLNTPGIPSAMDTILLRHTISSGPLLVGSSHLIDLGLAQINTQVALDKLDANQRQWLVTAFNGQVPFTSKTLIGFHQDANFIVKANPLAFTQDTTNYRVTGVTLTGSTDTRTMQVQTELAQLIIKKPDITYTFPKAYLQISTQDLSAEAPVLKGQLQVPQLAIAAQDTTESLIADLTADLDSVTQNKALTGQLTISLTNIKGIKEVFKQVNYQLNMQQLNVLGLQHFFGLQSEIRNTTKQLEWNAEALETPEGQQKQQELMNTLNSKSEQALDTLFNQALQPDKTRISTNLQTQSAQGNMQMGADLIYVPREKMNIMKLLDYGLGDWLGLFKGKLNLQAAKAALPQGVDTLLQPYVQQGLMLSTPDQVSSAIELKGDTVEVNGKNLTRAQWLKLLAPSLQNQAPNTSPISQTARDLGIPEDLMQLIDQQGLTPEIMQLLEESDDVPAETVSILKQLLQTQSMPKSSR